MVRGTALVRTSVRFLLGGVKLSVTAASELPFLYGCLNVENASLNFKRV